MGKTPVSESGLVLMDVSRIGRALNRIACEILEDIPAPDDLVLLGVDKRGFSLARQLALALEKQSGNAVSCLQMAVRLNSEIDDQTDRLKKSAENIVIVDDVFFSGTTLMKALRRILDQTEPANLQIAVLVDRGHHCFPITARYTGLNSPTKLDEHVEVSFDQDGLPEKVILTKN
jgi:pyrimidine operon attenuation protein / uracil phosphoribosyltransferase